MNFAEALRAYRAATGPEELEALQARFEEVSRACAPPRAGKRRLEATRATLLPCFQAQADELLEDRRARAGWLGDALRRLALEEPLVDRRAEVYTRAGVHCTSTYRSVMSEHRYASAAAEREAAHYRRLGLDAVVREREICRGYSAGVFGRGSYVVSDYEVWVGVDEVGLEVARRLPGETLREWVKACWAAGVNPRVYDPFLDPDFEERAGLDYQGRDRVVS